MAELTPIVTLTTISSTRANEWQARLVQRYSSVANRTTEHPSPAEGDLSYLEDSNSIWVYDGSSWVLLGPNLEVDGSVEVASPAALTGSYVAAATVNLTIPTTWGGWKCEAHATFGYTVGLDVVARFRIMVDGTVQQEHTVNATGGSRVGSGSVGGRRTGLSTTGSRAVSIQGLKTGTNSATLNGVYLYARAVRTS